MEQDMLDDGESWIVEETDDPTPCEVDTAEEKAPEDISRTPCINLVDVQVLNNPSRFNTPFQFEICFECSTALEEDLEWSLIYVGSSESQACDQTLDTIELGPIEVGRFKFVFAAPPPNPGRIPKTDIVGVTVVLLTCKYKKQEFVRVGYFVNVAYDCEELQSNPPQEVKLERLTRSIISSEPRCTYFSILWDKKKST